MIFMWLNFIIMLLGIDIITNFSLLKIAQLQSKIKQTKNSRKFSSFDLCIRTQLGKILKEIHGTLSDLRQFWVCCQEIKIQKDGNFNLLALKNMLSEQKKSEMTHWNGDCEDSCVTSPMTVLVPWKGPLFALKRSCIWGFLTFKLVPLPTGCA